jgi:hypothetical protein
MTPVESASSESVPVPFTALEIVNADVLVDRNVLPVFGRVIAPEDRVHADELLECVMLE